MVIITAEKLKQLGLHKLECSNDGQLAIDYCNEQSHGCACIGEIPVCTTHKLWCYIKATYDPASPFISTGYNITSILLYASEYNTWEDFLEAFNDEKNHNYFTSPGYFRAYTLLHKVKDHVTAIDATVAVIMKHIPEDTLNKFFTAV